MACFSFYATKNLTCGEGGAVVTHDDGLAETLRLLRLHGMTKTAADRYHEGYRHWDMTMLGWKYNMDNIQAALLWPQMDRLASNWEKREALARRYEALLGGLRGLTWPAAVPGSRHARHLFPVWVSPEQRDEVIMALQAHGIAVMVNYRSIHLLTYFRERFGFRRGDFPVAECIGDSTLSLPFYPNMPTDYVNRVVEVLEDAL
jgi:dTDP-4-amino-4,6-dideoxygalactose transaminase